MTAGWFDVMGAKHAGMQGVRVDRNGTPWEPFEGDPDLTVVSFHEPADGWVFDHVTWFVRRANGSVFHLVLSR